MFDDVQCLAEWEAAKAHPENQFMHVRGKWLIGMFAGVQVRRGHDRSSGVIVARAGQAQSAYHLGGAGQRRAGVHEQVVKGELEHHPPIVLTRACNRDRHQPVEGEVTPVVHGTPILREPPARHGSCRCPGGGLDGRGRPSARPKSSPGNTKVRSKSVLLLDLQAKTLTFIASLTDHMNHRRKQLYMIATDVKQNADHHLNDQRTKDVADLVDAANASFVALQKQSQDSIKAVLVDVETEEELTDIPNALKDKLKFVKSVKSFGVEAVACAAAMKEVTDRVVASLKMNEEMQKDTASNSAHQLRSQGIHGGIGPKAYPLI